MNLVVSSFQDLIDDIYPFIHLGDNFHGFLEGEALCASTQVFRALKSPGLIGLRLDLGDQESC